MIESYSKTWQGFFSRGRVAATITPTRRIHKSLIIMELKLYHIFEKMTYFFSTLTPDGFDSQSYDGAWPS